MFRQLVNAVSGNAIVAKLPSVGLRLNASKSESKLVMQCYLRLTFSAYAYAPELETDYLESIDLFKWYLMCLRQFS